MQELADSPSEAEFAIVVGGSMDLDPDIVDRSCIYRAFPNWCASMGPCRHRWISGITRFAAEYCPFSWSSACSGSELYIKALQDCCDYLRDTFGIQLDLTFKFACDNDKQVDKWTSSQFPELRLMFDDIADLTSFKAVNKRTSEYVIVPESDAFACGFSCLAKTPLNRNRSSNHSCIQDGTPTSTTDTFIGAKAWMVKSRPLLTILENLTTLEIKPEKTRIDETTDTNKKSDAEFITDTLQSAGFNTLDINMNASDFGSWAARHRKKIVSIYSETLDGNKILSDTQRFVDAMKSDWRMTGDEVLFGEEELRLLLEADSEVGRVAKKQKTQQWHDEHRVIYEHYKLPWPPQLSDSPIDFSYMRGDGRMAECAHLFHTAFPIEASEYGQWQSVDLQPTMSRSLGFQNTVKMDANLADAAIRNPWARNGALNTLTGSSRFLLRKKSAVGEDLIVRLMTGVEAMRAMGWDVQHYHHATLPLDASQHDVLATLAGRAFSGFSFAALASCAMAAIGLNLQEGGRREALDRIPAGINTDGGKGSPRSESMYSSSESD